LQVIEGLRGLVNRLKEDGKKEDTNKNEENKSNKTYQQDNDEGIILDTNWEYKNRDAWVEEVINDNKMLVFELERVEDENQRLKQILQPTSIQYKSLTENAPSATYNTEITQNMSPTNFEQMQENIRPQHHYASQEVKYWEEDILNKVPASQLRDIAKQEVSAINRYKAFLARTRIEV